MARKKKGVVGRRYLKWAIVALVVLAAIFYAGDWYSKYTTRIGVIRVSGSIDDFTYADQAYDALRDPNIKAVVVVVDSPGGTVQASFETEAAFRMLKMVKPVVVTMGEYAASGAYLVSTASDYIFARSATETAGIGVVAVWVSYENKWRGEGIEYYRWTSGEMKDLWAPYRSPTPEESAELQSLVDNLMNEVIARIRINRPHVVNIDELRDGSTIWGYEAIPYGLVDGIGDYEEALCKAADLADLKKGSYTVVGLTS